MSIFSYMSVLRSGKNGKIIFSVYPKKCWYALREIQYKDGTTAEVTVRKLEVIEKLPSNWSVVS